MAGRTYLIPSSQYGTPQAAYAHDMRTGPGDIEPIASVTVINNSAGSTCFIMADTECNGFPILAVGPDSFVTVPLSRMQLGIVVVPNAGAVPPTVPDGTVSVHIDTNALAASAGAYAGGAGTRNAQYSKRATGGGI